MAKEIERKFLVTGNRYKNHSKGMLIRQGYLNLEPDRTVRIRTVDTKGFLTIKGISLGATRLEYEYEIPVKDANEMLDTLCSKPIIEKIRFSVEDHGQIWQVDEFLNENKGLIVAEIELVDEESNFQIPDWIGQEVTADPKYYNNSLVRKPFINW